MKKFLEQQEEQNIMEKYVDFLEFCAERLQLEELPEITLVNDKELARENKSFGGYRPHDQTIETNIAERHMADVFRTLAHELVHHKQNLDNRLDENSGETGSDIENEANAMAGILMREYACATEGNIFEEVVMENYSGRPSWKDAQAIANKQLQRRAGDGYDVYVPHPTVSGTTTMLKSHDNLGAAKDTVRDYLRVHPDHQAKTAIFGPKGKHVLDTKTNKWAMLKEESEGLLVESKITGRLMASKYSRQVDHLGDRLNHLYNESGSNAVKAHLASLSPNYTRHLHTLSVFNMGQPVKDGTHPVAKIIHRHLKNS